MAIVDTHKPCNRCARVFPVGELLFDGCLAIRCGDCERIVTSERANRALAAEAREAAKTGYPEDDGYEEPEPEENFWDDRTTPGRNG